MLVRLKGWTKLAEHCVCPASLKLRIPSDFAPLPSKLGGDDAQLQSPASTSASFADRFMQTDSLQQIQGGQQIEFIENEIEPGNRASQPRVPSSKSSSISRRASPKTHSRGRSPRSKLQAKNACPFRLFASGTAIVVYSPPSKRNALVLGTVSNPLHPTTFPASMSNSIVWVDPGSPMSVTYVAPSKRNPRSANFVPVTFSVPFEQLARPARSGSGGCAVC